MQRIEQPVERPLLDRLLNAPHLPQIVPRLQPSVLHRIIQRCGLEDCGDLVRLATPAQLERVFDADLWRPIRPGLDEQFDADRFGTWLELLMDCGEEIAARTLTGMDPDLVIAGLAQHVRVFDRASLSTWIDGEEVVETRRWGAEADCEVGGFIVEATRTGSWDAIVKLLQFLDAHHADDFRRVMAGCRRLSNSAPEADGFHDLLIDREQDMFDLETAREGRRELQGYVTPAQARAFLQMAREAGLAGNAPPAGNPVASAYFRATRPRAMESNAIDELYDSPGAGGTSGASGLTVATAAVVDVLRDAGVLTEPRGLLVGETTRLRLGSLQAYMQAGFDRAPDAYMRRTEEFGFLANAVLAGCTIQARPLTEAEAADAAAAVCNLGLENWSRQWLPAEDLTAVFQVGWTVLHRDVCMYATEQLIGVLTDVRHRDRAIQSGLDALRIDLTRHRQAGAPWRARDALDVIAILDMPVWAALLGLIDECPVLHAAVAASSRPGTRSVSGTAFEFISQNSQIASIRVFLDSVRDMLLPRAGLAFRNEDGQDPP